MKRIIFCSIAAITILLSACSTDLDVIGDYKETIVVYGLLDQAQPKQYIKINKAFLGAGDAFTYAQIKDSTQFSNALTVKIVKLSDGTVYNLYPDNSMPKDPGIFYGPDQGNAIYSFMNPMRLDSTTLNPTDSISTLSPNSEYELTITNSETGTVVTAKTSLISDISGFINPTPAGTTFSFVITGNYPNYPFNVIWNSAKNARLYQVILRLHYKDSIIGTSIDKTLDYTLPVMRTGNLIGGQEMDVYMKGRDFFKYIGNNLSDYPGLIKRTAGKVDLLLVAGSDELSSFIDVNTPSTGIIQERPEYTNITNGLGLFSARLNRAPDSRPMQSVSIDSLACGQFTKQLKFLNSFGQVNGSGGPVICP